MGKFSELDTAIKDLREAAATINEVANTLAELFSGSDPEAPSSSVEPVQQEEVTLTQEEVRAFLSEKSRKGHTETIKSFLRKYGATKLKEVDPKDYAALMADAAALVDPQEDDEYAD